MEVIVLIQIKIWHGFLTGIGRQNSHIVTGV